MCGQIGECCSYNFAAESCYTKKLCSRLFSTEVEFYWQKKQNRVLCHALGDLGAGLKVSGLGGLSPLQLLAQPLSSGRSGVVD